jgi:hypothetical protein
MQAGSVALIEKYVDRAASALFAAAAGYAAYAALARNSVQRLAFAEAVAAAGLAYWLCIRLLAAVQPQKRRLPVPVFDVRDIDGPDLPELLLTETSDQPAVAAEEPLVLDDILAELGPDSRIVRLFDPAAMPTPGQISARIDRHLAAGSSSAAAEDASQALHDALAELRRSLS